MGTNYYFKMEDEKYHIGKSSVGWKFTWRTQPKIDVYSRDQWKNFITNNKGEIIDEYGDFVNKVNFFTDITNPEFRKRIFSEASPDEEQDNSEYYLKSHFLETRNEAFHFTYLDKDDNDFIMGEFS
jgi:hypothetical protein